MTYIHQVNYKYEENSAKLSYHDCLGAIHYNNSIIRVGRINFYYEHDQLLYGSWTHDYSTPPPTPLTKLGYQMILHNCT